MLMLERDPNRRISASELLQHSWIKVCFDCYMKRSCLIFIACNAKTN
jgi:serine/threonine protein kinase